MKYSAFLSKVELPSSIFDAHHRGYLAGEFDFSFEDVVRYCSNGELLYATPSKGTGFVCEFNRGDLYYKGHQVTNLQQLHFKAIEVNFSAEQEVLLDTINIFLKQGAYLEDRSVEDYFLAGLKDFKDLTLEEYEGLGVVPTPVPVVVRMKEGKLFELATGKRIPKLPTIRIWLTK